MQLLWFLNNALFENILVYLFSFKILTQFSLELHRSTYMLIFFNKFSWPFISVGFAYVGSTNCGLKTVFSCSQLWLINSWLNPWRADCRVKSYKQIFDSEGSNGGMLALLNPVLFKAQLYFGFT